MYYFILLFLLLSCAAKENSVYKVVEKPGDSEKEIWETVIEHPQSKPFQCIKKVLIDQGESISRIDERMGFIMTNYRLVKESELRDIAIIVQGKMEVRYYNGIYQLSLRVSNIDKASKSVRVRARIFGTVSEAPQASSAWWPLYSRGRLEKYLLKDIQKQCGHNSNTPYP